MGVCLKMMYEVYIDGRKVKEYPHKLQAVIYLILKGYCYRSRFGKWLDKRAEIRDVADE